MPDAITLALQLIARGDADVMAALGVSLSVSLTATVIACVIGAPLGALLTMRQFAGRRALLVAINAALGLPPVVAGLVVYMMLSRAGPLGSWGLLFTRPAMVICQVLLTLPIAIALTQRATEAAWRDYGDALRIDGAHTVRCIRSLLAMESSTMLTAFLAAFGRAIAEVGAIMIAGGNIRGETRTLTTAIVLETSKGNLAQSLALAIILMALTVAVSAVAFRIEGRLAKR